MDQKHAFAKSRQLSSLVILRATSNILTVTDWNTVWERSLGRQVAYLELYTAAKYNYNTLRVLLQLTSSMRYPLHFKDFHYDTLEIVKKFDLISQLFLVPLQHSVFDLDKFTPTDLYDGGSSSCRETLGILELAVWVVQLTNIKMATGCGDLQDCTCWGSLEKNTVSSPQLKSRSRSVSELNLALRDYNVYVILLFKKKNTLSFLILIGSIPVDEGKQKTKWMVVWFVNVLSDRKMFWTSFMSFVIMLPKISRQRGLRC